MKRKIIFILFVLFILFFLLTCSNVANDPRVKKGIINLSNFDFSNNNRLSLDGEWEFYWKEFITRDQHSQLDKTYIKVPLSWTDEKNGNPFPAHGYASYRLIIKTTRPNQYWGLNILDICTASRIYVNGRLMSESGIPHQNKEKNVPKFFPHNISFFSESEYIEIIIHVSNYYFDRAGLWKRVFFGESKTMTYNHTLQTGFTLLIIGALLSMSIYHLILYLYGKRDSETLFFGLFCALMGFRSLLSEGRFIIYIFPQLSWFLTHRLELITICLGVGIYSRFLKKLYPRETYNLITKTFFRLGLIFSVILILEPPVFLDTTFRIFIPFLMMISVYTIYINFKAVQKDRPGSPVLFAGSIILVACIVNDVLYSQLIISSGYYTPLGFIIFVICSEFTFNIRYIMAERALIQSEEKNKTLLNSFPDSIILINDDNHIIEYKINLKLSPLLSTKNLKGKLITEVFPENFSHSILKKINEKNSNNEPIEIKHVIDNIIVYYELRFRNDHDKMIIILRNITERKIIQKKLEDQKEKLQHADKLASLGTLVAGVAHEINNPNTSILLSSEIHKQAWNWIFKYMNEEMQVDEDIIIGNMSFEEFKDEMEKSFERIVRNSQRIKMIVEELKTFSKKEIDNLKDEVNLNNVIESAIFQLKPVINGYTDNFITQFDPSLPVFRASPYRLEQVFVNVIKNACHALEDKSKKIEVTTYFLKEEQEVIVEIVDEGIGMDEDTKRRIMDPFFTTKRLTGGLGLGLSISNKIVEDHGGKIIFLSNPGKGTTVRIVFKINKGAKDGEK